MQPARTSHNPLSVANYRDQAVVDGAASGFAQPHSPESRASSVRGSVCVLSGLISILVQLPARISFETCVGPSYGRAQQVEFLALSRGLAQGALGPMDDATPSWLASALSRESEDPR